MLGYSDEVGYGKRKEPAFDAADCFPMNADQLRQTFLGEAGLTARYPWAIALMFGLVHGIGFAGALAGLGIEHRLLPWALLSFNLGVEAGQLAFVLTVLALIWAHRRLTAVLPPWGEALPAYAIGSVAMFWFIGRLARLIAAA